MASSLSFINSSSGGIKGVCVVHGNGVTFGPQRDPIRAQTSITA